MYIHFKFTFLLILFIVLGKRECANAFRVVLVSVPRQRVSEPLHNPDARHSRTVELTTM